MDQRFKPGKQFGITDDTGAKELTMLVRPGALFLALMLALFVSGGWFVPVLERLVPPEQWGFPGGAFRSVSVWVLENVTSLGL